MKNNGGKLDKPKTKKKEKAKAKKAEKGLKTGDTISYIYSDTGEVAAQLIVK